MTSGSRHLACLLPSFLLALFMNTAAAQTQRTEHTYKLDSAEDRPAATLEDVAWLTGSWSGEAFGGSFEQTWSPPSGGSMLGMFKTLNGDEVGFYELLLLVEEEGSLSLKVKHFSTDFFAWEEKEEFIDFRFIRADEGAIHFSGLSFYRIDADTMLGYVAMRNGDEIREEKLTYRRRR
ncbi:MAG: DUF6265 family protein [Pseudomonadota bacterium]